MASVEEQLTRKAEVGGVQIEVFPMKKAVFESRFPKIPRRTVRESFLDRCMSIPAADMG